MYYSTPDFPVHYQLPELAQTQDFLHTIEEKFSKIMKGLPWWLSSEESACNAGYTGSVPGLGRSPGKGNGNPLHYSCLGNPVDTSLAGYSSWGHKRVRHSK